MSVDKTKCCSTHTTQREESGECCQTKSIHQLAKENPTLTYRQVEKIMKEQNE